MVQTEDGAHMQAAPSLNTPYVNQQATMFNIPGERVESRPPLNALLDLKALLVPKEKIDRER